MPIGPYSDFNACVVGIKARYRKSNPDWTEDHLNQVASAICGQMEKQTRQGLRVAYQAKYEPFTKDEHHFIKVYNLEDEVNNNNWGVTAEARARSLRSFFDQPLLGPPNLSDDHVIDADPTHPHFGVWAKIGRPVDVINNGATYGIYEVTVPEAWEMIQAGQLAQVSPSIRINEAHWTEDGKEIITDFNWDHTLFVDVGAIPKAGVVGTCTAPDPSLCGFRQAVQAALQSHGSEPLGLSLRQDVAGYSTKSGNPTEKKSEDTSGGVFVKISNPFAQAADAWNTADAPDKFFAIVPDSAKGPDGKKSDRKLPLASVQKKDYDEAIIKDALARLPQTDFAGTGSSMAAAKAKICAAAQSLSLDLPSCQQGQGEAQGENKMPDASKDESGCNEAQAKITMDLAQAQQKIRDLESRLQARDEVELNKAALGVVDLEVQAGLIKEEKRTERVTELKKFGAPALSEMQARYTEMVSKVQAAKDAKEPHRLKADFDEAFKDPAQAASVQEQVRQAQFGRTRTPEELAKLEQIISGVK
jgi:hypothetical protein